MKWSLKFQWTRMIVEGIRQRRFVSSAMNAITNSSEACLNHTAEYAEPTHKIFKQFLQNLSTPWSEVPFFGFLAVPPLCGVTWLGTASSDLAPLAVEHVDVIDCLPKNCAIATIRDYLGVSHFKLQHASHPDALSFDQPIIDNSRCVMSAADGINVQRVDRLFSGLGCSGTSTMFNRCLLFMQFFGFLAVPPLCGVTWLGTASSDLDPLAVEHVDVIECLPKNCAIATIRDYLGVSHFKLQHASHPDALSFDQPIIDNSRSVTSAADGINVQRVDRLFSGLGCSGTGTMFNRCLLFMQCLVLNRFSKEDEEEAMSRPPSRPSAPSSPHAIHQQGISISGVHVDSLQYASSTGSRRFSPGRLNSTAHKVPGEASAFGKCTVQNRKSSVGSSRAHLGCGLVGQDKIPIPACGHSSSIFKTSVMIKTDLLEAASKAQACYSSTVGPFVEISDTRSVVSTPTFKKYSKCRFFTTRSQSCSSFHKSTLSVSSARNTSSSQGFKAHENGKAPKLPSGSKEHVCRASDKALLCSPLNWPLIASSLSAKVTTTVHATPPGQARQLRQFKSRASIRQLSELPQGLTQKSEGQLLQSIVSEQPPKAALPPQMYGIGSENAAATEHIQQWESPNKNCRPENMELLPPELLVTGLFEAEPVAAASTTEIVLHSPSLNVITEEAESSEYISSASTSSTPSGTPKQRPAQQYRGYRSMALVLQNEPGDEDVPRQETPERVIFSRSGPSIETSYEDSLSPCYAAEADAPNCEKNCEKAQILHCRTDA
ncbi:uncharacterized protein [Dermacentor albipictus]|uniref:uncharacterized protein n=1 Tax=Dermacentor albipictus TaxID=60249 RepID=UPI0038FCD8BD